jgi:hypothetical protein
MIWSPPKNMPQSITLESIKMNRWWSENEEIDLGVVHETY